MSSALPRAQEADRQQPIAIIGMACIFPGAGNLRQYWSNIQNGVNAITDVPPGRWDPLFYDPTSTDVDRFYCRKGGFVDDFVDFDPVAYGIMPKAAASADPDQLLSLRVGVEALRDAGLWQGEFNREKTGVIIGRGNYLSAGTLRLEQHVRTVEQTLQTLRDLMPDLDPAQLDIVKTRLRSQLSYYGPDTAVGLIPNLVASRLANRLDLNGPAYTVDGACASALLAVEQSCQLLRSGAADVMLSGGLHFTHDLTFWATFCQLGALSRSGKISPFSSDADGILAGEGIGMLVLKRLEDALADGDRIYAAIQGVASASDGNSSGLLAPAVEGQLLALQRAWQQTPLSKEAIGLVEAHGTGTPTGDRAELETLAAFFGSADKDSERAGLGSVKSMIGHTMPAAGAAGLIKAALAIYHGVLPITLQAEKPHPLIAQTRFTLLTQTRPWQKKRLERVAAVNAFGFGGINAHVVLSGIGEDVAAEPVAIPAIVCLRAATQQALLDKLAKRQWLTPQALAQQELAQQHTADDACWRLAIIDPDEKRLALAKTVVEKGQAWQGRSQIYFSREPLLRTGKIAFLFPGVDSMFDPQVRDLCAHFQLPVPAFCEKLDPAQALLKVGLGLTGLNKLLHQVLRKLRIQPDGMAGHSVGEWSALAASGCLSQALIDEVNAKMDPDSLQVPEVNFLAVASGVERVRGLHEDLPDVYLSHDNCPHQIIFCGRKQGIATLSMRLKEQNLLYQVLPIVSGFHSPLLAEYARPFTDFFNQVDLAACQTPLWSANSAQPFPADTAQKRQLITRHLLETVRFREMLDNMYQQGFRAFIQVGFGSLTGFVTDTLKGRPHFTIAANVANRSGMEQLCHLVAGLWVEGASPDFSMLIPEAVSGDMTNHASPGSTTTIRLKLGVPLIKIDQPLQRPVLASPAPPSPIVSEARSGDPLQILFQQTLTDIRQVSEDILQLWQQRQVKSSHAPAQGTVFQPARHQLRRRLDINDNIPAVLDHAFYPQRQGWPVIADRHPVIPLTMEISLMRSALEQVLPDLKVIAFESVRAFSWLIVEEPVEIEIEINHLQPDRAEVTIKGYIEAHAVLAPDFPEAPVPQPRALKNARDTVVDAHALYADNWMFHGPAYQSIVTLGPIGDDGIYGRLKVSSGEGALLDNMGQLAGYWVMEQDVDCLAMPIGIERIDFFNTDPAVGEELDCQVFVRQMDQLTCITDHELTDGNGRVRVRIHGWQTRRYAMDKTFWIRSKQVEKYLLSESFAPGFVLFEDRYETAITRDYMARRYLNQPETTVYNTISPRRKRQWLNGRIVAKDAVRDYLWREQGHFDFYPKELLVENNAAGMPMVRPHITDTYCANLHISIAHKDNLAVGIASDRPVGIDIELIEPRAESFIELALAPAEQQFLQDSGLMLASEACVTCIWAAKEAVAKKQGTGLEGNPKAFVVEEINDDGLIVNGQEVGYIKYNNYIICWTK